MGGLLGYSTNWKIPEIRSRNRNRVVIFPIEKMTWIPTHCFQEDPASFIVCSGETFSHNVS